MKLWLLLCLLTLVAAMCAVVAILLPIRLSLVPGVAVALSAITIAPIGAMLWRRANSDVKLKSVIRRS
jgi:hypothetical protein